MCGIEIPLDHWGLRYELFNIVGNSLCRRLNTKGLCLELFWPISAAYVMIAQEPINLTYVTLTNAKLITLNARLNSVNVNNG